jgi:hypothetical protein
MRFFSSPASGMHSGSTLSASHEPPGRIGASQQLPGQAQQDQAQQAAHGQGSGQAHGLVGGAECCCFIAVASYRPCALPPLPSPSLDAHDLPGFPLAKNTALTLRERFREDRLGLTASSLTFTTTIALVP